MIDSQPHPFAAGISLLDLLEQRGWRPVRDYGREEVAGLCPFHKDRRPSFYVNRRKQVFYCHGCGRGGGFSRLARLLGEFSEPVAAHAVSGQLLDDICRFYRRQLEHFDEPRAYLAGRGIHDRAVIERMSIGYAPGAVTTIFQLFFAHSRAFIADSGKLLHAPVPSCGQEGTSRPRKDSNAMKFQTLQEVREWRNSEQIECLLCHRKFGRITNTHVITHGLTQNEYRALFGIPWSYSLTSAKSRAATARSNKNAPFLVPREKGDPAPAPSKKPRQSAVVHYWRNFIGPLGPKNAVRGPHGRYEKKAA